MPYDYEAAHSAGVPDTEIISHLSTRLSYDYAAASKAGVPDSDVLATLLAKANEGGAPLTPGNIDLTNRPHVRNEDGSISTVRSMSFEEDGHHILVPTISDDGKRLDDAQAIAQFHRNGKHLGIFASAAQATEYAKSLHAEQERMLARPTSRPMTLPQKAKTIGGAFVGDMIKHRLKPFIVAMNVTPAGRIAALNYMVNNGLEENLAKEPDVRKAHEMTLRNNIRDFALTSLDVGSLGAGAAATTAIRAQAAVIGLKGWLGTLAAGAVEGGAYGVTYEGLAAAIEGESARKWSERTAKGLVFGAGMGAGLGAAAHGAQQFAGRSARNAAALREVAVKAQQEAQAAEQAFQAGQQQARAYTQEKGMIVGGARLDTAVREHLSSGRSVEEILDKVWAHDAFAVPKEPPVTPALSKEQAHQAFEIPTSVVPDEETIAAFDQATAPIEPSRVKLEQRARHVPYYGPPEMRHIIRAQGPERQTLREQFGEWKNRVGGAFVPESGAHPITKGLFLAGREATNTAGDRADLTIARRIQFEGNRRTRGWKSALLSDYMYSLDKLTTIKSRTAALQTPVLGPDKTSQAEWENAVEMLGAKMAEHPDVLRAHESIRNLLDEMHSIMVERGYIPQGQKRENYIPAHRIFEIAEVLQPMVAGTPAGRGLDAMLKRTATEEYTKTNVVQLLRESLHALNHKTAEDDMFMALVNSPLNMTDKLPPGEVNPKMYKRVRPGRFLPDETDRVARAAAGVEEGRGVKELQTYIFPTDVARRLEHFYQRTNVPGEKSLYAVAKAYSRQLTLYNPSNLLVNRMSDPFMALLGLPGEQSNVTGFVKAYPRAVKAAWKGAFSGTDPLYERAVEEGVAGSTFIKSVGGNTVPAALEAEIAQGDPLRNPFRHVRELMVRTRQAVEADPRIAAGLAAEAKSGNPADFARVGQEATLHFGAGDPDVSRLPIARVLAPFWKWNGLATSRLYQLATTPGSRARTWAAITGPPVAAALWNLQNEEFRKVEYSLSEYDRSHMHIILKDPKTGKVLRKANGEPYVWRLRMFVPEEVLAFFGAGNLPGRAYDMATGYTTPREFAGDAVQEFGRNVAALPAALVTAGQVLTGRSSLSGEDMETVDRFGTVLPAVSIGLKTINTAVNEGIGQAMKQTPARLIGIRATGSHRGRMDAKIRLLESQKREAEIKFNSAAEHGDKVRMEQLTNKIQGLGKRLNRLDKTKHAMEGKE